MFFSFLIMLNNHAYISLMYFQKLSVQSILFQSWCQKGFKTYGRVWDVYQIAVNFHFCTSILAALTAKVCVFHLVTVRQWPLPTHAHPLTSWAAGEFIMLARACSGPSLLSVSSPPSRTKAERLAARRADSRHRSGKALFTGSGAWSAA